MRLNDLGVEWVAGAVEGGNSMPCNFEYSRRDGLRSVKMASKRKFFHGNVFVFYRKSIHSKDKCS